MKNFTALIIVVTTAVSYSVMAASYSTEATITPLPDNGQYRVDVSVSRMVQRGGKVIEEIVAKPRILSGVGCPASLYQGLQPANPDYQHEDNVSVDVSWPYPDESGVAFCTVVVKHGDELVSKSKLQLQIAGKGRVPLVLSPQTVDPKSVRVEVDKSKSIAFVLLEFAHRPDKEARSMAIENLGNRVDIRDAVGHSVENGIISGTYKEIGVALQYDSKDRAQRVADILDGAP